MVDTKDRKQLIEPGDCILFATADWDEPYWTNKQHCAKELTRLGGRVLYIESVGLRAPIAGSKKDLKRIWLRLRKGLQGLFFGAVERQENLWVLSPLVVPGAHGRKWVGRFNQFLLQWSLKRHVASHAFIKPLIWTYHPFMLDAIKRLDYRSLLYHCVDDLACVPGIDATAFRDAEERLLQCTDVAFATTQFLTEKCLKTNPNTYLLPNVVDSEHFGKAMEFGLIPEDLANIPEPRLVYHGVLSDFKVDFRLLYETSLNHPEWSFVIIGEEREGQSDRFLEKMKGLKNVHFLGYRKYKILPNYMRGMAIGLLPTLLNDYTESMFPMKYYEYVASGLRVVSTPLCFSKNVKYSIAIGSDTHGFAAAINQELNKPKLSRSDVSLIVGENTWRSRTNKMLMAASSVKKLKMKKRDGERVG